jgi:DNA-binding GntR family transcriptional regulator
MSTDPEGYAADELHAIIETARARHTTAQDFVLDSLRVAILQGVLAPGLRLRQEDLAAVFATSRIPIRDALGALEYEGLVRSLPRRGFTVSALDADEIEEIYELRILLESHAIQLAVPLFTEADIADIKELYDATHNQTGVDQQLVFREQSYLRLYSVTGRPRLVGLITRLRQEVARSLRWLQVEHSPAHHAAFIEAVLSGDADEASRQLAVHYRKVAALLRRYLRSGEGGRAGT